MTQHKIDRTGAVCATAASAVGDPASAALFFVGILIVSLSGRSWASFESNAATSTRRSDTTLRPRTRWLFLTIVNCSGRTGSTEANLTRRTCRSSRTKAGDLTRQTCDRLVGRPPEDLQHTRRHDLHPTQRPVYLTRSRHLLYLIEQSSQRGNTMPHSFLNCVLARGTHPTWIAAQNR